MRLQNLVSLSALKRDSQTITMRIAVHDFVGHPFQIQLSRVLAERGNTVLHLHFPQFETPKGRLEKCKADPSTLQICPIELKTLYTKYSPIKRLYGERQYTSTCCSILSEFTADVVLSGNAPPYMQHWIRKSVQRSGTAFVAWMQDLYGFGLAALLRGRLGPVAWPLSHALQQLDVTLARLSDGVVYICPEFEQLLAARHPNPNSAVIHNWAPLEELPTKEKTNAWSVRYGVTQQKVLLYSGTLGLKHNPELLVSLASHYRYRKDVTIIVVSQGRGREHLERQRAARGLTNLLLLDFQPFEDVPDMIGSADVLLAIIEPTAAPFSVPSKVLTYLCAGKPLLLSVPPGNLAARIVKAAGAGAVVEPGDTGLFIREADRLLIEESSTHSYGRNGREFAAREFDIDRIASRFELILSDAVTSRRSR